MKAQTLPRKIERIHSLDSLRAIMMLLGLVIHSAISYAVLDYSSSWPLKATNSTHLSNDVILIFIHFFRMPLFFLVAGFFGAMLFYERGVQKMVKNRVSRIIYPLIVFLFILTPLINAAFTYSQRVFEGDENAFETVLSLLSSISMYIPDKTFHLWFLYYLVMITGVSVLLALLMKKIPQISGKISQGFEWVFERPILRILVFASCSSLIYLFMGASKVDTSFSLIPDINTFAFYFFFYIVGWVLFKSKHLLGSFTRFDWACMISGIFVFFGIFLMNKLMDETARMFASALLVWLLIFGITGLFIRYGSKHSALMRYISDASYWVYLAHLMFTAVLPGAIAEWPLHPTLKFLFVMTVTLMICFASYHLFVRTTFIGQFLNGRKYSRRFSDIKQAEKAPTSNPVLNN